MRKQLGLGLRALVCASTLAAVIASNAAAASPKFDMSGFSVQVGTPVTYTSAQQAIIAQKEALALQELQSPGTVYRMSHPAGLSATYVSASGTRMSSNAMTPMVADPDGAIVGTWVRQQTKAYYCGPTAVQVVGDYAWQTGPNTVHNTQQYISNTWTKTDQLGQTPLANEVTGMNGNVGSEMPSGFIYASAREPNTVAGGAQWHAYLREDIGGFYMPQVASVSPKQSGAAYQLPSWQGSGTAPAGNYGHYIVFAGYITKWDGNPGNTSPYLFYDDGSGGYGGGTGEWSDSDAAIYYMMWLYNSNHAAGYFIW
jgi:hypothetical protein